jgi:ATP-dependent Clp protease adapter protein ClpS
MNDTVESAKQIIIDLLQASDPCQFRSIVVEVLEQVPGVGAENAMPVTITALAELMADGIIQRYEGMPMTTAVKTALAYAWEMADDVPHD